MGPDSQPLEKHEMASKQDENVSKDVSHIPLFNGLNYPEWKFGILLLFRRHSLTEVVERKETKPQEKIFENQVKIWKKLKTGRLKIF